jgi:hypothetical protein
MEVKIEVTQSWGQPIAQALISETQAKVLVVPEKRFYIGELKNFGVAGTLLPAGLDVRQIWGAMRGFPVLPDYASVISHRGDQLTFLNSAGRVIQTVDFDPVTHLPRRMSIPDPVVNVSYADLNSDQGILFARSITIESTDQGLTLGMEVSQTIFNQPVPEEIFSLNPPPGYEIHPLP